MIVESAFFKLPELLTRDYDLLRGTSEATVVHLLSVAILMELNARNVLRPFAHIEVEKPYPIPKRDGGIAIRADLFVDFTEAIPGRIDGPMALYGARAKNWVEAKAFVSSIKHGSTPDKTGNAGRIARDLLRLCLLPGESLASRYLLTIFSSEPSESVALRTSDQRERTWLARLLTEGYIDDVELSLSNEPKTLREAMGPGFVDSNDLQVKAKLRTLMFQPRGKRGSSPAFWGYLTRIRSFQIALPGLSTQFGDEPGSERRIEGFKAIRDKVLGRL
jgi:hypothetical protein